MKRLECLDGLRGVLAVYVMVGHMAPFSALPDWTIRLLSHGGAAVDVFFVLSGMVIVRSLESHGYAARPFLVARVARIFPVYLAMFAVAVAAQAVPVSFAAMPWIGPDSLARDIWASGWPAHWGVEIAAHLTMTHGLFPNGVLPDVWVSFLGAAWSLSTEWQFYVLALVWGRLGPRLPRVGGLAAFLMVLAGAGLVWDLGAPEAWRFSRAFLPNKAHYFALGVASSGLAVFRGAAGDGVFGRGWAVFLAVIAAVMGVCAAQGGVEKIIPPVVWAICLAAQAGPGRLWIVEAPLRAPFVQYLGVISYPIYLANEPVQRVLGVALAAWAGGDAWAFSAVWLPGAVLLPLGAAAVLHRYVERPGIRLGRVLCQPALPLALGGAIRPAIAGRSTTLTKSAP